MKINEQELINMSTQELEELLQIIANIQMDRKLLRRREIANEIQNLTDEASESGATFIKDSSNIYREILVYVNDDGSIVFAFQN